MTVEQLIEELGRITAQGDGWREIRYAHYRDSLAGATRIDKAIIHGGAVVLTTDDGVGR